MIRIKKIIFTAVSLLLLTGCVNGEAEFPKAESFTIEATASYRTSTGPRTFEAVITENYTEFTSENLPVPVRFEHGLLTCGETTVEAEPKKHSLFRLSEFFRNLFSDGTQFSTVKEDGYAVIHAVIDDEEFVIKADAKTLIPSVIFGDDYTVAIREINLE